MNEALHAPELLDRIAHYAGIARWVCLGLLCSYGLHQAWILAVWFRHRRHAIRPVPLPARLPRVTVQLPFFNEGAVGERAIDAACALDWPPERIQIQVLDDSDDGSERAMRARVEEWRRLGRDIVLIHRTDRTGYKAGALDAGLDSATGEFIAIFDSDFLPPTDFLQRTIGHFEDPSVGVVQTRWAHLNRRRSLLTSLQAIQLDGHFAIEHSARCRSGRWLNFNGTGGVWRRAAIDSAGGWEHDTITEDLDLSYRAQMAGWRIQYLEEESCPGELPPEVIAFKRQQHRWMKGTIQNARKLLPKIVRARAPIGTKLEAFFHLTAPATALILLLAVLLHIVGESARVWQGTAFAKSIGALLIFSTSAGCAYYAAAERAIGLGALRAIARLPALIALGAGMSVNNSIAVFEALIGRESPFVRTPKFGDTGAAGDAAALEAKPALRISDLAIACVELVIGSLLVGRFIAVVAQGGFSWPDPFFGLFALGFIGVGAASLRSLLRRAPRARKGTVAAPEAEVPVGAEVAVEALAPIAAKPAARVLTAQPAKARAR